MVDGDGSFSVEMPRAGFFEEAYGNLQKIIASKAVLLKKVLGTDSLDIETSEERLIFPMLRFQKCSQTHCPRGHFQA